VAADPGNYPGVGSPGEVGRKEQRPRRFAALGPLCAEVSLVT